MNAGGRVAAPRGVGGALPVGGLTMGGRGDGSGVRTPRWLFVAGGALVGAGATVLVYALVLGWLPLGWMSAGPVPSASSAASGESSASDTATPVPGASASLLSTGGAHACRISPEGLVCWGADQAGQLGTGVPSGGRDLPTPAAGLGTDAVSVSAGTGHTCVLTPAGGVRCAGANEMGQLGQGLVNPSDLAANVVGLESGVAAVSAGGNLTCAVLVGGGVKCWGANTNGELGNGSRPVYDARGEAVSGVVSSAEPVDVTGLASGVLSVDAGGQHTCAVLVGGSVRCWGRNFDGQLGDGAAPELDEQDVPVSGETASGIPVEVVGLGAAAVSVTAGDVHTCAVLAGGAVRCWGGNLAGQLGDGVDLESESSVPNRGRRDRPGDVVGLASGVVAVSAGDQPPPRAL